MLSLSYQIVYFNGSFFNVSKSIFTAAFSVTMIDVHYDFCMSTCSIKGLCDVCSTLVRAEVVLTHRNLVFEKTNVLGTDRVT
jgi:hypothetical protein